MSTVTRPPALKVTLPLSWSTSVTWPNDGNLVARFGAGRRFDREREIMGRDRDTCAAAPEPFQDGAIYDHFVANLKIPSHAQGSSAGFQIIIEPLAARRPQLVKHREGRTWLRGLQQPLFGGGLLEGGEGNGRSANPALRVVDQPYSGKIGCSLLVLPLSAKGLLGIGDR